MKKIAASILAILTILSTPAHADECSIANYCSDMNNFWLQLVASEKRGSIVSITTRYNTNTQAYFTLDFSGDTYAEIVDANGNIFEVDTRVARQVPVGQNGLTDVSLRFVVDENFEHPFDYYIVSDDNRHGSVAITNIPIPYPN